MAGTGPNTRTGLTGKQVHGCPLLLDRQDTDCVGRYSRNCRVRLTWLGYWMASYIVSDCHHVWFSLLLKSVRYLAGCD